MSHFVFRSSSPSLPRRLALFFLLGEGEVVFSLADCIDERVWMTRVTY